MGSPAATGTGFTLAAAKPGARGTQLSCNGVGVSASKMTVAP